MLRLARLALQFRRIVGGALPMVLLALVAVLSHASAPDECVLKEIREPRAHGCDLCRALQFPAHPQDASRYARNAIHNLRVALDLMASDLVRIENGNTTGVYFPFSRSKDQLENQAVSQFEIRG